MARAEDIYERIVREGEKAIDEFIQTRASEELFLDFKRSADNGGGLRLHDGDRNNLAKAICGFGNSEGGVIVWGVDCRTSKADPADAAKAKYPLADAARFRSQLEGAVSGCSIPVHSGVRNHAITTTEPAGYVVTLIPASLTPPHQVPGEGKYYIRAGSNFVPAPHQVLAGMFGRRPQPVLTCTIAFPPVRIIPRESGKPSPKLRLEWEYLLTNIGSVSAREVYLNVNLLGVPGSHEFNATNLRALNWEYRDTVTNRFSAVSHPDFRFAPQSSIRTLGLICALESPIRSELRIEATYGCDGAPMKRFDLHQNREEIEKQFWVFVEEEECGISDEKARKEFARNFLKCSIPFEST